MTSGRTFTVIHAYTRSHQKGGENLGGTFRGTPIAAAKKAATRICRHSKIHGRCALDIIIKETTPGSKGKIYGYHTLRKATHAVVDHQGTTIHHKYEVIAKAIKDLEGVLAVASKPKKKTKKTPPTKTIVLDKFLFTSSGIPQRAPSRGSVQPPAGPPPRGLIQALSVPPPKTPAPPQRQFSQSLLVQRQSPSLKKPAFVRQDQLVIQPQAIPQLTPSKQQGKQQLTSLSQQLSATTTAPQQQAPKKKKSGFFDFFFGSSTPSQASTKQQGKQGK